LVLLAGRGGQRCLRMAASEAEEVPGEPRFPPVLGDGEEEGRGRGGRTQGTTVAEVSTVAAMTELEPDQIPAFKQFTQDFGQAAFGPHGFLKTLPHAIVAVIALVAILCFSVALVFKEPYDATVAAILPLLSWHVYLLLNERFYLERSDNAVGSKSAIRQVPLESQVEDLDLAAFAEQLGIPVQSAFLAGNSDAVNRLMLTALAKDHLRCVAAIKTYRDVYGPLLEQCSIASKSSGIGKPTLDLVGIGAGESLLASAVTPRSPRGPPSPEQQRRRKGCNFPFGIVGNPRDTTSPSPPHHSSSGNENLQGHFVAGEVLPTLGLNPAAACLQSPEGKASSESVPKTAMHNASVDSPMLFESGVGNTAPSPGFGLFGGR